LASFLVKFGEWKKPTVRDFSGPILTILTIFDSIGIYRKTAPTKSTVLGPRPPPWRNYKFYRKYGFFMILGPSIQPKKPSVKSASTPYPPSKVVFIVLLIIRDPISHYGSTFLVWDVWCVLYFPLPFIGIQRKCYSEFFWFWRIVWRLLTFWTWLMWYSKQHSTPDTVAVKKGQKAQYTGENAGAGNSSLPNFNDGLYFIATQFIRSRHRP
jgi:hypothetical protein